MRKLLFCGFLFLAYFCVFVIVGHGTAVSVQWDTCSPAEAHDITGWLDPTSYGEYHLNGLWLI